MRILFPLLLALSLNVSANSPPAESFDQLNETFPDFIFFDPAGKAAKLSDYRGKVVVVKLWATWCGVCRAKWPQHQALYDSIGENPGVEFITLSIFENPEVSQAWVDEQGFDMPLFRNPVNDRGAVGVADGSLYFIKGTPMKFLIDKDGVLRKKAVGSKAAISEAEVRDLL